VITTRKSFDYWCPGPVDQFSGDQLVTADITLITMNACAVVFLRDHGTRGYELSFCSEEVRLERYDDAEGETLVRRARNDAFAPGQRRAVTVGIVNDVMTATVDGHQALEARLTDSSLAAGHVVLGATNNTYTGESSVAFADIAIRGAKRRAAVASPGTVPPAYADLLHGPTTSAAKLLSFDATALSAVVEPVIFTPGRAGCEKYGLPTARSQCPPQPTVLDSHTKITLAVDRAATARTTREGTQQCLGTMTGGGTCPLPLTQVAGWLQGHSPALVSITSTDGTLTGLSELYTA
jgi:hypothetical protein